MSIKPPESNKELANFIRNSLVSEAGKTEAEQINKLIFRLRENYADFLGITVRSGQSSISNVRDIRIQPEGDHYEVIVVPRMRNPDLKPPKPIVISQSELEDMQKEYKSLISKSDATHKPPRP